LYNSRPIDRERITLMGAEPGPGIPVGPAEGQYTLPLGDLLRVIWERLWIVLSVTVVLTSVAVGLSLWQTPTYEASIKKLVGQEQGSRSEGLGGEVQGLQQLTQTMAEGVKSRPQGRLASSR
jgi:uncharacterized protein involved in exopolysaccharide biosynthesis